jgi:hypothetical protein
MNLTRRKNNKNKNKSDTEYDQGGVRNGGGEALFLIEGPGITGTGVDAR